MRPFLVLALLLAGCVAPAAVTPADAPAAAPVVLLAWQGAALRGEGEGAGQLARLAKCLAGVCEMPQPACEPSSCERVPFDVPDHEEPRDLVVRVRWPADPGLWFVVALEDARGETVARGRSIVLDHDGAALRLERAPPGAYTAVVVAASGEGTYQLDARLEALLPPGGELLPDLVTLPPTDLRIASPPTTQIGSLGVLPGAVGQAAAEAMGARGCAPEEAAEGARRCLRFSNLVGNAGLGPLDIRLSLQDGASSPAGGAFRQRVHAADGTWREVAAGAAEFHAIHAHWHNAAANGFAVYAYEATTGTRGETVAEGRKTGICFADVGLVWEGAARVEPPAFEGAPCFNPATEREWRMGLAPGWYDEYSWILSDQYVDIEGLPDGTYLLCAATNIAGLLVEADAANNEACVPFALRGDEVTELAPRPYYAAP